MEYKGRIKKVYSSIEKTGYITSGIKKADQPLWDSNYYGSNGTYSTGTVVYRYIMMNVAVYDIIEKGQNTTIPIDIRDIAFKHFKRQKVSDKFIEMLKHKLEGKKITVKKLAMEFVADEEEIVNILS